MATSVNKRVLITNAGGYGLTALNKKTLSSNYRFGSSFLVDSEFITYTLVDEDGNPIQLNNTFDWSINFWVKVTQPSAEGIFFAMQEGSNTNSVYYSFAESAVRLNNGTYYASPLIPLGAFNMHSVTFNSATQRLSMYINAQLPSAQQNDAAKSSQIVSAFTFTSILFKKFYGPISHKVANFAYLTRTLSEAELLQVLYNKGSGNEFDNQEGIASRVNVKEAVVYDTDQVVFLDETGLHNNIGVSGIAGQPADVAAFINANFIKKFKA